MSAELTQKSLNSFTYWEELHGAVQASTPIVVLMHWMTGTFDSLQFLLADISAPARLIYLQAPYPLEAEYGGYTWFPQSMDFYDKLSEAEQAPLIKLSADTVAKFIQDLREQYPAKVIVTGFSQGGDISLALGVYYPHLVDYVIPGAGRLSPPMRPAKLDNEKLPTFYLHIGSADHIVSVESCAEITTWLKAQGAQAELFEYEGVGHEYSLPMIERIQSEIAEI